MNFSYPFIHRPIGTTLLGVGLFLVGAVLLFWLVSVLCTRDPVRPAVPGRSDTPMTATDLPTLIGVSNSGNWCAFMRLMRVRNSFAE